MTGTRPPWPERTLTPYVLPDGTRVQVDATAAKGAPVIDFTLLGGRIVTATRADLVFTCPRCGRTSWHRRDVEERYCGACHVFLDP